MTERQTPKSKAKPKPKKKPAVKQPPDPSLPLKYAQQERFAQLCVDPNYTQHSAYQDAYPSSTKWKPKSVDEQASKMATKVLPRIEWLKSQVAEAQIGTIAEVDAILFEMIKTTYADHMLILPDGEAVIHLTPDSPRKYAVHSLKQRIEVTKAEEGGDKSIARIIEYKLHDRRGLIDTFYKRRAAYPPTKIEVDASDEATKMIQAILDAGEAAKLPKKGKK